MSVSALTWLSETETCSLSHYLPTEYSFGSLTSDPDASLLPKYSASFEVDSLFSVL